MRVGLVLASGTLLRIVSKNLVLISVVSKKLSFLSLPAPASWWPGPSFWSPATRKQSGVAILISVDFNGKVSHWRKDPDGRVLSILIQFNSFAINLVCIYASATCLTDQKVFFETIQEYIFLSVILIFTNINLINSVATSHLPNICLISHNL